MIGRGRRDETDPMVGSGRRLADKVVFVIVTKHDSLELVAEIRDS
jgi:hypothetical protein